MKLAIIINPASGRGRAARKVTEYVKSWPHREWEVALHMTYGPGHAGELAAELAAAPPDRVAICGGDGTVNEVATRCPSPPFPVALLPAGTANVLAHELGIPREPIRALEVALNGTVRRIDLGILNARAGHRFVLMAGVGFDAYVASKVNLGLKRRTGIGAYYVAAARCLMSYSFSEFHVSTENTTLKATSCLIANGRSYGGGLVFTPEASMTDGLLDMVTVSGSKLCHLRYLISAWRRNPKRYPWVHYCRIRNARVEGRRGPWVHVDGELIGTIPLEISLEPVAFPLVVPR